MQKLCHIALITRDTEKLKQFYQKCFGIVLDFETEDKSYSEYTFLPSEAPKFDLEHKSLLESDMPSSEHRGIFLRFEADSLEDVRRKCLENDGKIVREAQKQEYGSIEMYLEDPEANLIQVYENN